MENIIKKLNELTISDANELISELEKLSLDPSEKNLIADVVRSMFYKPPCRENIIGPHPNWIC